MRISDWSSDVCSSDLLAGALRAGWQLSASYNYNDNEFRGSDSSSPGERADPNTPRHQWKLWTTWRPQTGPWHAFEFGGGMVGQSRAQWLPVPVISPDGVRSEERRGGKE